MAVDGIDLALVLEQTLDSNQLESAQQQLKNACSQDAGSFLLLLSDVLRNTVVVTSSPAVRKAAGIQLKNFLATRDIAERKKKVAAWKLIDPQKRSQIQENVLGTLGTENASAHAAPSVVATLALAEIVDDEWPQKHMIPSLCKVATDDNSTQELRQACLESIRYICEDVEGALLEPFADCILTAIVFGINPQHASPMRLAATHALMPAVHFCKRNFDNEQERNVLMQEICVATQQCDASRSTDSTHTVEVRVAALQCINRIIPLYYQHMKPYMEKALYAISFDAMKSEVREIAMQGIEFWSTVAEEERELNNIVRKNALDVDVKSARIRATVKQNYHFVNAALGFVCPLLLEALKQQSDGEDEDEWTVAKAASVCLMFLAQAAGDDVVAHVLPFAGDNIVNPDWRCRDAAATAIGSILEGPDAVKLRETVVQALPFILVLMRDGNATVRDSASWTMARICDNVKEAVLLNPEKFGEVLMVLYENLRSTPKAAAHSCYTLASLAEASYNYAVETMPPAAAAGAQCNNATVAEITRETDSPHNPDIVSNADRDLANIPSTYPFSSAFDHFVKRLLEQTVQRPNANEANLRAAAYEALSEIVKHSASDCAPTVNYCCDYLLNLSLQIIEQLKQIVARSGSSNEWAQYGDWLQLILPVINDCLRRLPAPNDCGPLCERGIDVMFQLLDLVCISNAGGKGPLLSCGPEAFTVLSTLIMKLQNNFQPHLPKLGDHVVWAMGGGGNAEGYNTEHTLSAAACSLLSDICKSSLGPSICSVVPSSSDRPGLMERLINLIRRAEKDPSGLTRIIAISCISDIAMLLNIDFMPYTAVTFGTLKTCLHEACESPVNLGGGAAAVSGADGAPSFSSATNNINDNAAAGTAATSQVGRDDGEESDGENSRQDWLQQRIDLRDSVIECFDIILDSLGYAGDHHPQQHLYAADQQVHAQVAGWLQPCVDGIMSAVEKCCRDDDLVSEAAVQHSAGLIASLTLIFGVNMLSYLQTDYVLGLVNRGRKKHLYSEATKSACTLAAKQIKLAKMKAAEVAASAGIAAFVQQQTFFGNNATMSGTQTDAPSQMGNKQPVMLNDYNNTELLNQHSQAQQHHQFGDVAFQCRQ